MSYRYTGNIYVRKTGNDANDGLTPATAKKTIAAGIAATPTNGTCVVLAGDYVEGSFSFIVGAKKIQGDGLVRIIALSPDSSINTVNGAEINNVTLKGFANVGISGGSFLFHNCRVIESRSIASGNPNQYNNEIINCPSMGSTLNPIGWKVFNSIVTILSYGCTGSYINESSTIVGASTSTYAYNNIQGTISISGACYAVPKAVDIINSTAVNAWADRVGSYPAIASGWLHTILGQTVNQCYFVNGNYNADPQFVDPENMNFSVLPTSPMLGRWQGNNTAYVTVGQKLGADTFTKTNLSGTTDLTVETPNTEGYATSPIITVDPVNARTIGKISYLGGLNFNSSFAGGSTTQNNNVPKVASYTKNGVVITNNSPRPCVMIRWTHKTDSAPTSDAEWTNPGANNVLPGEWVLAEIGATFKIDQYGYGNGDERHDSVNGQQIRATYYQVRVLLTDTYNF